MTTDLARQLDDLAASETTGLDLRHPALPAAVDLEGGARRGRPALALVAAAAVLLVVGGWWISRESMSAVDVAGGFASQPIPALLLEPLTPLSELPERLQEVFIEASLTPPERELNPGAAPIEFDGVRVVPTDNGEVIIGLDTSQNVLCLVTTLTPGPENETAASSCGSPAGFMLQGSTSISLTTQEGAMTAVFVPDDVVAVEMGSREATVVRNVATFDVASNAVLRLRRADGTVEPAAFIPDPDADGELVLSSGLELDLAAVGCAIQGDRFVTEAAFTNADGFVSATVTPEGVFLTGGGGEALDGVMPDSVVETANVDGSLVVTATWDGPSAGSLRIDCGDRLLDVGDLR